MDIPDGCRYTKTHEWIRLEGDTVVVGITDHAQQALGDITFVELPAAGRAVDQGSEIGVIESVKAASDLFSPLSGEVAEVNGELEDKPELVNESPHDKGWMLKLRGTSRKELAALMDADAYRRFLESEA